MQAKGRALECTGHCSAQLGPGTELHWALQCQAGPRHWPLGTPRCARQSLVSPPSPPLLAALVCASGASLAACPHAECQPSRHGVVCAEWTRGSHSVPLSSIAGVRHLGSEKETTITTVCLSAPPDIMVARQLSFAHRLRTQLLRAQLMLHVMRHHLRPLRCASHRSTPLLRRTTIVAGVTRWRRSIARDALFFSSFFFWWPSGGCDAQASRRRVAGMS